MGLSDDSVRFRISASDWDKTVTGSATEDWIETVDEFVEKSHYSSRSAAIRSLVILGMRSFVDDPRSQTEETSRIDNNNGGNGHPDILKQLIPEGRENAIHILDVLPEKFEKQAFDLVEDHPEVNRDGVEVWK